MPKVTATQFKEASGVPITEFAANHGYSDSTAITKQLQKGSCRWPRRSLQDTSHPLYPIYKQIKDRCYNPKNKQYKYYGGRGIRMCGRWYISFRNFVEDMGDRPDGYSIDRINPDLGYTTDNCRWADSKTQANNRRIRKVQYDGQWVSSEELALLLEVSPWTARRRMKTMEVHLGTR